LVKYLILFTLFSQLTFAGSIEKEVENILGKASFSANKGLVSVLFKKRTDFFRGNKVDILKVLQTLKKNDLLDLRFQETTTIQLSFATTETKPLLFIKTIKDVLNSLGYNHTLTAKALRDTSGFLWKVTIRSASVIDPVVLAKEVRKRGGYLNSVKRYSKDNWRYNVDIYRAHLLAKKLPLNKEVSLKKPLKPYWIETTGARTIKIDSKNGNKWHPYIVFYDADLNILDNYTKERKSYNATLKIPNGSKYVKISDIYTLENIKRGLKIQIRK